jgi:hypothetical protein
MVMKTPKMTIQIAATKSGAKDWYENITMELGSASLYTDGSGIEGKIGAAVYQMDTNTTQLQHLRSEAQYNVFAAELTVMCLSA